VREEFCLGRLHHSADEQYPRPDRLRRASSRMGAFQAAKALLIEAEAREAQRKWLRNAIISIRVQADPDRP
jgi:hypothetical protein